MNFKGKKIVIMGLGLHGGGLGAAKWLSKQGAKLIVTDLRTSRVLAPALKELKKFKNIQYVLGKHRIADFKKADLVIKNPGVPNDSKYLKIARQHNIPIETDINLFFSICPAPIIGITGTRGKTTTVSLLGAMFKSVDKTTVIAGNIRKSPLDEIKKINNYTPVILELSSWQLESLKIIKQSPHLAVVTNVMKDHLNRYSGLADYIKAKKLIYQYQDQNDFVVLNRDNQITKKMGQEVLAKRYWFSAKYFTEENGCFVKNGKIIFRRLGQETPVIKINELKLTGQHNLQNVLAAITAAMIYNLPKAKIIKILKTFKGVADRQEFIKKTKKGISYYNDTTATTPDATIAALNNLAAKKNIILIAGGADKKLDFNELAKVMPKKVKALVLLEGTATDKLFKAVKKNIKKNNKLPIARVKNMLTAVGIANSFAKPEDIILLSPACASFGLFINEFDRGDQFKAIVKKLK